MYRQADNPSIPELPNTIEELSDLLLKNSLQILRQGEVVSEHGGPYRPGGVAVNNVDMKCPYCTMEFTAVQRSGCFSGSMSPSTCPNCYFPSNVLNALRDLRESKKQEDEV